MGLQILIYLIYSSECRVYRKLSTALFIFNNIIDYDLSDCANYSAKGTLLINQHITSGLNRIYMFIYQLFLYDVPCCGPLLNHLLCCTNNIEFHCTFRFLSKLCFSIVIVKLPCLCICIVSSSTHTLLRMLTYTRQMDRL